jgi:hypothetical protein
MSQRRGRAYFDGNKQLFIRLKMEDFFKHPLHGVAEKKKNTLKNSIV